MKIFKFEDEKDTDFKPGKTWRGKVKKDNRTGYYARPKKKSTKGFRGYSKKSRITDTRQMCVVKTSKKKSMTLHNKNLAYIQREGKGYNGSSPELYGTVEDYLQNMDNTHYRLIISPENQSIDIKDLTEQTIKAIEQKTGYKLNWVACDHYDKPHKHSHVLINGIDLTGKKVNFHTDFLSKEIRDMSRNISTVMVGERSREEIYFSDEKKINKLLYTPLDRKIDFLLKDNHISEKHYKEDLQLYKRLQFLEKHNYCFYSLQEHGFVFPENWNEKLKIMTKYNTYVKGFELSNTSPENYKLHTLTKDGDIEGKIIHKFFMQEDSNNHAVLLQNEKGFHYVPLPFGIKKAKIGESISIRLIPTEENKQRVTIQRIQ